MLAGRDVWVRCPGRKKQRNDWQTGTFAHWLLISLFFFLQIFSWIEKYGCAPQYLLASLVFIQRIAFSEITTTIIPRRRSFKPFAALRSRKYPQFPEDGCCTPVAIWWEMSGEAPSCQFWLARPRSSSEDQLTGSPVLSLPDMFKPEASRSCLSWDVKHFTLNLRLHRIHVK